MDTVEADIFKEKIKPQLDDAIPFRNIDPQLLVDSAKQIGQQLSSDKESDKEDGLKHHQLRKFYNAVKQIERHTLRKKPDEELSKELVAQLLFLRPHLANAQRKDRGGRIEPLCDALNPCLASNIIQQKADLTRFVKFFEAIVAYTD